MKLKYLYLAAAVAALTACNNGNKSGETTQDSQILTDSVVTDTPAADSAPADSTTTLTIQENQPKKEAKEEAKSAAQAEEGVSDKEVDKIIGMINMHTDAVKSLSKDGIPPTSSIAFNLLQKLPDYNPLLNKIKKKLSPEQAERIEKAKREFEKEGDSWIENFKDN